MRTARILPLTLALAALAAAVTPANSQNVIDTQFGIDIVLSANAACGASGGPGDNRIKLLVDASSSVDCDLSGGGSTLALCACDSGTLRAATVVSTTTLVTTNTTQTVTGQKTFNQPIYAGGGVQKDGTTGSPRLSLVADGVACVQDDSTGANAVCINGPGESATLKAASAANLDVGGQNKLTVQSAFVWSAVPLRIPAAATLPTCNGSLGAPEFPAMHFDTSSGFELCVCNGTSWSAADGSGTCT